MSRSPYKILIEPVTTERTAAATLEKTPKYTFRVDPRANKREIRSAVELAFKVKVLAVNTVVRKGKLGRFGYAYPGRRPDTKIAVVTIAEGQQIALNP